MAFPGDGGSLLTVAYYHHSYKTEQEYELASLLMEKSIRSVRKWMPFADICHLRANKTPPSPSAQTSIAYNQFGERPHHHSLVPEGNVLFLDVDCLVMRDVFDVFYDDFDVALCVRPQFSTDKPEGWFDPAFNAGAVFSKSRLFWQEFADYHRRERHQWDDGVLSRFVRQEAKQFALKFLPSDVYNYTPRVFDEDLSGRAIVHYKGEKKKYWMKHAAN